MQERPDKGHQFAYQTHIETQDDILQTARHAGWNNTIFGDHRNNVHREATLEKIFELDAVGAKPNCLSAQAARKRVTTIPHDTSNKPREVVR